MKNKLVIVKNGVYFKRHITDGMNHYVRDIKEAKIFNSFQDIEETISKYKIKKYDIGILYWKGVVECN